jgi:hypothetical protein
MSWTKQMQLHSLLELGQSSILDISVDSTKFDVDPVSRLARRTQQKDNIH